MAPHQLFPYDDSGLRNPLQLLGAGFEVAEISSAEPPLCARNSFSSSPEDAEIVSFNDLDDALDDDDDEGVLEQKWQGRTYAPNRGVEIFVGGLTRSTRRDMLRDWFQHAGEVTEVRIARDKRRRRCRGYGYVRFATSEQANRAIETMHRFEFKHGRFLGVLPSDENRTLFVGGLREEWSCEYIERLLKEKMPGLRKVEPIPDREDKQKIRTFCFLEFATHEEAALVFNRHQSDKVDRTRAYTAIGSAGATAVGSFEGTVTTAIDINGCSGDRARADWGEHDTRGVLDGNGSSVDTGDRMGHAGTLNDDGGGWLWSMEEDAHSRGSGTDAGAVNAGADLLRCPVGEFEGCCDGGGGGVPLVVGGAILKVDWADPLRYHIHLNGGIKGPSAPFERAALDSRIPARNGRARQGFRMDDSPDFYPTSAVRHPHQHEHRPIHPQWREDPASAGRPIQPRRQPPPRHPSPAFAHDSSSNGARYGSPPLAALRRGQSHATLPPSFGGEDPRAADAPHLRAHGVRTRTLSASHLAPAAVASWPLHDNGRAQHARDDYSVWEDGKYAQALHMPRRGQSGCSDHLSAGDMLDQRDRWPRHPLDTPVDAAMIQQRLPSDGSAARPYSPRGEDTPPCRAVHLPMSRSVSQPHREERRHAPFSGSFESWEQSRPPDKDRMVDRFVPDRTVSVQPTRVPASQGGQRVSRDGLITSKMDAMMPRQQSGQDQRDRCRERQSMQSISDQRPQVSPDEWRYVRSPPLSTSVVTDALRVGRSPRPPTPTAPKVRHAVGGEMISAGEREASGERGLAFHTPPGLSKGPASLRPLMAAQSSGWSSTRPAESREEPLLLRSASVDQGSQSQHVLLERNPAWFSNGAINRWSARAPACERRPWTATPGGKRDLQKSRDVSSASAPGDALSGRGLWGSISPGELDCNFRSSWPTELFSPRDKVDSVWET